ncbi:MAG: DUF6183 family protein [Chloroflexota bacterium]
MIEQVEVILSDLRHTKNVQKECQTINELAKMDATEALVNLYQSLFDTTKTRYIPEWAIRIVSGRITRSLILLGSITGVVRALELKQTQIKSSEQQARYIAAMLASAHTTEKLVAIFRKLSSDKDYHYFLTRLIQEMVVYDHNCSSVNEFKTFWENSKEKDEIYRLPLSRSELEHELPLRHFTPGGSVASMPFGPLSDKPSAIIENSAIELQQITAYSTKDLIEAALNNWMSESNGKVISGIYEAKSSLWPTKTQVSLPIDILKSVGLDKAIVTETSARRGFGIIFGAAANGGAYNQGIYGAEGRLSTWKTIAGLSGMDWSVPFDELVEFAKACKWYKIEVTSEWFYQVAWDIGLTVHSPADTLGILFATDTD